MDKVRWINYNIWKYKIKWNEGFIADPKINPNFDEFRNAVFSVKSMGKETGSMLWDDYLCVGSWGMYYRVVTDKTVNMVSATQRDANKYIAIPVGDDVEVYEYLSFIMKFHVTKKELRKMIENGEVEVLKYGNKKQI